MSGTRFVTVTLSPLFERTVVTKYLAVGHRNRTVKPERLDPSGLGVNVARALHRLGCEVHAVVLLGRDLTGRAYHALVADEGFGFTNVPVEGPTSSQTCILDTGHSQQTVLTTEAARIAASDIHRLAEILRALVTEGDTVVLGGPLPSGAPEDSYARLVEVVHGLGAEAVLATGGPALGDALGSNPEIVALSQLQCESFYNVPIRVQEDQLVASRRLREQGAGRVLLEMQQTGSALLVTDEGNWKVDLPDAQEGTTSGVWEALLAGLLAGRCHRIPLEESLEMAVAAATYAADEIGVAFGSASDVGEYRVASEVHALDESGGLENPEPEEQPASRSGSSMAPAAKGGCC